MKMSKDMEEAIRKGNKANEIVKQYSDTIAQILMAFLITEYGDENYIVPNPVEIKRYVLLVGIAFKEGLEEGLRLAKKDLEKNSESGGKNETKID